VVATVTNKKGKRREREGGYLMLTLLFLLRIEPVSLTFPTLVKKTQT